MVLLILMAMLTACAATPQDLSGKMFNFQYPGKTAHVRLTPSIQDLRAVTVCLRFITHLSRDYSLFSLATSSAHNEFLIYKNAANDEISVSVGNKNIFFQSQNYTLNTWHSLCSTWDSATEMAHLWSGKNASKRKPVGTKSNINKPFIIILGQDQDSYGGRFDTGQSFVGMMSDVHMWDFVLSPCEILAYMNQLNFTSGNVLDWRALEFYIAGSVLIEQSTFHH